MDRDIFETSIRTFKNRRPFRVFTIALENGDRLEIDHPEAILVRDGTGLFAGPGGIPAVFDNEGVTQIFGDLAERAPASI